MRNWKKDEKKKKMPALLWYTVAKQLCWSSGLKQHIEGSILVNFIIIKQRNLKKLYSEISRL